MNLMGLRKVLTVTLGVAALSAVVALSCRTPGAGSQLRSGAGDDVDAARNKVSISKAATGTDLYEVRFFPDGSVAPGQPLYLRWDVISNYSDQNVDCAKLKHSETVAYKDQAARRGDPRKLGGFDMTIADNLFQKCSAGDNQGRKISLACQKSGDWNGPKRIEGCVYADAAGTTLLGKGWGLPKVAGEVVPGFGLADADVPDINQVVNYGKICAKRLGHLPAFDCRQGTLIPITVDGVEIPFGKSVPNQKCDHPAYLGLGDQGQCVPYTRFGKLDTGNPDVDTLFVCRRYYIGDQAGPWPADKPWHNDVAVIEHNRKSGDTCWYQALSGFQANDRPLSTWRVPPPDEEALPADVVAKNATLAPLDRAMPASDFWILPDDPRGVNDGFACVKCHDSDPFMMSPYVAQITERINGLDQYFIHCDPSKPGQTPKRLCKDERGSGKYSMVSKRHQAPAWKASFTVAPKDPTARECVSCHRIGTHNTCDSWARESIGRPSRGDVALYMADFRTPRSLAFPMNHWMPVRPNTLAHAYASEAAWNADFKKSADAQLACCDLFAQLPASKAQFDQVCEMEPVITLPLPDGGGTAASILVLNTSGEVAIPDATPAGVTVPLAAAAEVPAKAVQSLSAHIVVKHSYIGHVKIELIHGEQSVVVYDGAVAPVPAQADLDLMLKSTTGGSPLAAFVGQLAQGAWQVRAVDSTKHEVGKLSSFELNLTLGD